MEEEEEEEKVRQLCFPVHGLHSRRPPYLSSNTGFAAGSGVALEVMRKPQAEGNRKPCRSKN